MTCKCVCWLCACCSFWRRGLNLFPRVKRHRVKLLILPCVSPHVSARRHVPANNQWTQESFSDFFSFRLFTNDKNKLRCKNTSLVTQSTRVGLWRLQQHFGVIIIKFTVSTHLSDFTENRRPVFNTSHWKCPCRKSIEQHTVLFRYQPAS